jgi:hypothetical protein
MLLLSHAEKLTPSRSFLTAGLWSDGSELRDFIQEVVRHACERGEMVDIAAVADTVTAEFPDADRRAVVEALLSAVVWATVTPVSDDKGQDVEP